MLETDRLRLEDMRLRIERIREWSAGLDLTAFESSIQLRDEVAVNLQVIGETSRRLSPEILAAAPEIPWQAIIALRNRIAHGYETVNFAFVWRIVRDELPSLDAAVRRLPG